MKNVITSLRALVSFRHHRGVGLKDPDPWTHWQWLLVLFLVLTTVTTSIGAYLFIKERYGDPFSYSLPTSAVESLDRSALKSVLERYRAKTLEYSKKIEARRVFVDPTR